MPALHREVLWQVNAISRVLKKSYTERERCRMKNSATLPFLGQGPRFGQVLWKKRRVF